MNDILSIQLLHTRSLYYANVFEISKLHFKWPASNNCTINSFQHSWIKRVHLNFHGVWFLLFVQVLFCPLKIKSFIKQLHMQLITAISLSRAISFVIIEQIIFEYGSNQLLKFSMVLHKSKYPKFLFYFLDIEKCIKSRQDWTTRPVLIQHPST